MRLLNASTLKLEEFFPPKLPSYAILSHTWEEEEITLQELYHPTNVDKKGFQKIRACSRRALADGHDWIWVDTCCIDKTSSAELSEAINSMFRYYQEAAVCYAYLSDVPPQDCGFDGNSFKQSRWFTRGWTLQELIAPKVVEFYDQAWTQIGTKSSLKDLIHDITGIRGCVLQHKLSPLAVCVAERLSWAAKRSTTREEDIAYCLLGLLNINMPLLYGEGPRAFVRLQVEFLRTSEDLTIFLWADGQDSQEQRSGVLASSPAAFGLISVVNTQGAHMTTLNSDWNAVKLARDPLAPLRDLRGQTWQSRKTRIPGPPAITSRGLHLEAILLVLPEQPDEFFAWTGCVLDGPLDPRTTRPVVGYLCVQLSPAGHEFRIDTKCLLWVAKGERVEYARLWDLYLAIESSPAKIYLEGGNASEDAGFELDRVRAKPQLNTYMF